MLNKIKLWIKSSDIFPLLLVLYCSPLSPLVTLSRLKKLLEEYDYLPDEATTPDELKEKGYAPEFIKLYEASSLASRTGRKESLKHMLDSFLLDLRTSIEMMSYNLDNLMNLLQVVAILIPFEIFCLLIFLNPRASIVAIYVTILGVIVALGCIYVVKKEYRIKSPKLYTLIPLVAILFLYLYIGNISISLLTASVPALILQLMEYVRYIKEHEKALSIIEKAASTRLVKAIGIENPDELLSERYYGFSRTGLIALYMILAHGGSKYYESTSRLLSYMREMMAGFKRVRGFSRQIFIYGLVMAVVAAASVAIAVATVKYFASVSVKVSVPLPGIYIPSQEDLAFIESQVDLFIALCSLTFSIGIASARDGNPLYFPLYLPAVLASSILSYSITLNWFTAVVFGRPL